MTTLPSPSEFERLKRSLYERVDSLHVDGFSDEKMSSITNKMYDLVGSARSVDTLRVYDYLLLGQKDLYRLHLLRLVMEVLTTARQAPISHLMTQALIDRTSDFCAVIDKEDGGYHFFSDVRSDIRIHGYLNVLRDAVILGDQSTFKYVTENLASICDVIKEREISDPQLLLESISIMRNGSKALVSGAL